MRILVTGANGFLGRKLCEALITEGHELAGLVREIPSEQLELSYIVSELPDLDVSAVKEWAPEAIVHAAFDMQFTNLKKAEAVNLEGSAALLKLAREMGAYFLFVSSMSCHEEAVSTYGRHKLSVERSLDLSRDGVIRPGHIIGEGGIFLRTAHSIQKLPFIPLFFGGKQLIQTVAIEDIIAAMSEVLKNKHAGIFHISEIHPVALREFYGQISKNLGKTPRFIHFPGSAALFLLQFFEKMKLPLPITSDNLKGLKKLKTFEVTDDLAKLGLSPKTMKESVAQVLHKTASEHV